MIKKKMRRDESCLPTFAYWRESHMFCVVSRSRQQQQQCFHQRRRKMRWRRDEAAAVHKRIYMVGGVKRRRGKKKEEEEERRRVELLYWKIQHTRLFSISPQKIARKRLLCRLFSWFFWKPNLYSHFIFLLVCLTVCVRALLSLLPCWKPCINLILYVSLYVVIKLATGILWPTHTSVYGSFSIDVYRGYS